MFYKICFYFLLFFIYSFFGWIIETLFCSYQAKKPVLNRGFLIGPYIPIYGTAAVIMVLFLTEYKSDPFVLFCMASVYSSILEYLTSLWMEKVYHAEWWDYTNRKFNLNGRICLENSICFGLLGMLLIYLINPLVESLLQLFPNIVLMILAISFGSIMLIDFIITQFVLSKLNIQVKNIRSDATETIDNEFKNSLSKYRLLYKRMFNAFPKLTYNKDRGNEILKSAKDKLNEIETYLKEKKKQIKEKKQQIKDLRKKKTDKDAIRHIKEEIKKIRKER